jgi:hypothetical protein
MDPEADIWNKWPLSEPDAITCTRIDSHSYKRMLHIQTISKVLNFLQDFSEQKE